MKKVKAYHVIILILAMLVTAFVAWHDYKYDRPAPVYTTSDYVLEISIMGPVYTAIFYGILWSILYGVRSLFAWYRGF